MWPFKPTELDILAKNAKGSILVVGPMGSYRHGDPTLPLLIKFIGIKGNDIVAVDYKGAEIGNKEIDTIPTYGDLHATKESLEELHEKTIHYALADALRLPFPKEIFGTVIDRITHQYIFANGGTEKQLIKEYTRVLKRNGKIIFFCSTHGGQGTSFHYETLLKELTDSKNFKINKGKIKIVPFFKKSGTMFICSYPATHYIVAEKLKD